MILDINVHLHYRLAQPTDLLLQIEAADGGGQQLVSAWMAWRRIFCPQKPSGT
jgi:hypothetical protein